MPELAIFDKVFLSKYLTLKIDQNYKHENKNKALNNEQVYI